ncbi:EAL domain-containing protein [Arthrobacter globiformis]|uniref:EAL domain-containing protein n=1 Tax=Arthrobacter globiformis TaxID=1665 RepID=UPI000B41A493|nr:EAL domain-containing protein [Arthrobacter globiformis]
MESRFPNDETWRQQDWPGSGAPVVREQAYEIIQAVLAGTDPAGEAARERLREHVAAHPGNPETALREHLVFSRSLLRHMTSKPRSQAESLPQRPGEQDKGVPAKNRAAIEAILQGDRLVTAFQPITDLARNEVIGAEALTRFVWENGDDAGSWFRNAAAVGLGADLEFSALRTALTAAQQLPPHLVVALNVSPAVCLDPRLSVIFENPPLHPSRIMLELTERVQPDQLQPLLDVLAPLRRSGVGLAVDEAGPDPASMRHIRALRPDVLKVRPDLIAKIDTDPGGQYLLADLVEFGNQTGAAVAAVGIETANELAVLTRLGISAGQGHFLGKPTLEPNEWVTWATADGTETVSQARHRAPEPHAEANPVTNATY